jgi:hypothetical protein
MCQSVIVEKTHENLIIVNETTGDEWVRELTDGHGVVVKTKHFIESNLFLFDLLFSPLLFAENPHPKIAIVHVASSELVALAILRYLFYLDVAVFLASKLLDESYFFVFDTVHDDIGLLLVFLLNGDGSG